MTLCLYRDKRFKNEIVRLEGEKFIFRKMSAAQAGEIERSFDGASSKDVYYKLSVTHPDFPELSLPEPLTGKVIIRVQGRSMPLRQSSPPPAN